MDKKAQVTDIDIALHIALNLISLMLKLKTVLDVKLVGVIRVFLNSDIFAYVFDIFLIANGLSKISENAEIDFY